MPTSYEIFLKSEGGFNRVTSIEANNPDHAYRKLADAAEESGTDAGGDYLICPTGNVTYLRGTRKVKPSYEILVLDLPPEPTSLSVVPAPAEEEA